MRKAALDIITLPIELSSDIAESKFRLVHIAAQRVRQLAANQQPIVDSRSIKDTTLSLEESLTGMFKIIVGAEARKAKEEFLKRQEEARLEEQLSAKEEEIRKELSAYLSEEHEEEAAGDAEFEDSEEVTNEEPAEGVEEEGEE